MTGAGIMACKNALSETDNDMDKAAALLKERSMNVVEKKKDRTTGQGLVESYIHTGGRIGAMVEINCETNFVAKTPEFQELAHNVAMQVAAMDCQCILPEDVAEGAEAKEVCLLLQPYIRDLSVTIQDLVNEVIAKTGENVKISRFVRFELGVE